MAFATWHKNSLPSACRVVHLLFQSLRLRNSASLATHPVYTLLCIYPRPTDRPSPYPGSDLLSHSPKNPRKHGSVPGASGLRRSSHTSCSRIAVNPSTTLHLYGPQLRLIAVWRALDCFASLPCLVTSSVISLVPPGIANIDQGIGLSHIRTRTGPVSFSTQRAALPIPARLLTSRS